MKKLLVGNKGQSLESWAKSYKLPPSFAKSLFRSINEPSDFPYFMENLVNEFMSLKKNQKEEVRKALIRIQVGISIDNPSDPVKVTKQLFVVQVIEKLMFGYNLLSSEEETLIKRKIRRKH